MYKRMTADGEEDSGKRRLGTMLPVFVLAAALVWLTPEVVAQMDPCLGGDSRNIGYLPRTALTDLMVGGTRSAGGWTAPAHYAAGSIGTHAHGSIDYMHQDDSHGHTAGNRGQGHTHSDRYDPGDLSTTGADTPVEAYDGPIPVAYAQIDNAGTSCSGLDRQTAASTLLHGFVQTVLFVMKIVTVLGVIGAVGVMRLDGKGTFDIKALP